MGNGTGAGIPVTSSDRLSGRAGRGWAAAPRHDRQWLAVKDQAEPAIGGVVAGVDVQAVGLLVGEDHDGGGVDVGDGATVGVVQHLSSDGGGNGVHDGLLA
ncbi:MAG TPA: hypothetical protein VMU94_19335, partial [Streptosporangiaceae bacterium]|nr:hypothetical protein [Streptosporangiaceae bacterium]